MATTQQYPPRSFWYALVCILLLSAGAVIGVTTRMQADAKLPECFLTTEHRCAVGYPS
jgi:hypothetical protein